MREIRPSGSEGGVGSIPHSYPYRTIDGRAISKATARLISGTNTEPVS